MNSEYVGTFCFLYSISYNVLIPARPALNWPWLRFCSWEPGCLGWLAQWSQRVKTGMGSTTAGCCEILSSLLSCPWQFVHYG